MTVISSLPAANKAVQGPTEESAVSAEMSDRQSEHPERALLQVLFYRRNYIQVEHMLKLIVAQRAS